jgi:hypothetical protein
MIKIEKKEIITTQTISHIEILNGDISIKDRFASFPVRIYDDANNLLSLINIEIRDEEYDAWNSDDYIESIILSKLEMVKIVEPEVVVTPEVTTEVTPDTTPDNGNTDDTKSSDPV